MVEFNASLFIILQFGSRFANSFLVTAARYELLEAGGVARFAWAQVATNLAKMVAQQIAGLLTDNFPLKRMYVATEACNLVVAIAMYIFGLHGDMLFALNICLGLLFSFSQPVTKSMPPAVTAKAEDLAIINGWDLTCDKIGRYLAPMAYAMVSSSHGFRVATLLSCFLYAVLALARSFVKVEEPPGRGEPPEGKARSTVAAKLKGLGKQIVDGVMSLRNDSVLRLLILNTLVTNVFLYPLNSVHFPVLFKHSTELGEQDTSTIGLLLQNIMDLMGIKKKKMWMNYTALVSLGGVVGPFLSIAMTNAIETYSKQQQQCRLWAGVNFGVAGQLVTTVTLAIIIFFSGSLGSGMLVFLLVLTWVLTIAVNNIVTTYFNSISQQRLQRNERGRYIANIITIFTLGSSWGTMLFGWVLSGDQGSQGVAGSVNLLIFGFLIKCVLLVMLRSEGKGSFAVDEAAPKKD